MKEILNTFCNLKGITYDDLTGRSRKQPLALYRQCVMYVMRTEMNYKVIYIAALLNKNHSSVAASVKKIKHFLAVEDKQTIELVREIKKLLEGR